LAQLLLEELGINPKAAGMLELGGTVAGAYLLRRGLFMPWELNKVLEPNVVEQGLCRLAPLLRVSDALAAGPRAWHAKVATLESSLYMRNQLLRDTDWASMAHSMEVRVPLVDCKLLESIAKIDIAQFGGSGKRALAIAPKDPLPHSVVTRAKTGFTTPIGKWMRAHTESCNVREQSDDRERLWARGWSIAVGSMSTQSRELRLPAAA
jgi:asparagine synthase (glutamine-hydrolysing)